MRSNGNGDSHKSPEELEREIEAERAHIIDTLEALENKFSPGEIVDQALSYARRNGGELSRNFVDTVTRNPVPALLTVAGIAWMMYGQSHPKARSSSLSDYDSLGRDDEWGDQTSASYGVDPEYGTGSASRTSEMKERAAHLKEDLKQSAQDTKARASFKAQQLKDGAQHWKEGMSDRSHRMRASAQQRAQQVSQGFNHMLSEQPLALGAIGIALGSILGASMPVSERERELAESARQRVSHH